MPFTVIGTLTAEIVRQVELTEPEEQERGEYRHDYGYGEEAWCPVYATLEEACEVARKGGRHVHVEF